MDDSSFFIRVTLREILMGVSILYLALPVDSSTRVVRRGLFLTNRSVQPFIDIARACVSKSLCRENGRNERGDQISCVYIFVTGDRSRLRRVDSRNEKVGHE